MITDDERKLIVERITLEAEVRKELAAQDASAVKGRWAWAESKLGLLVIGAVITGVLVPVFQTTQENIKWARQNRYDILKYRLESVRSSMKELVLTQAFVAEAYARMRTAQSNLSKTDISHEKYRIDGLEMQNRRFQQNAKFVGSLGQLDENEREVVRSAFNNYLSSMQQLLVVFDTTATRSPLSDPELEKKESEKLAAAADSLGVQVESDYEKTFSILKLYVHRLEKQGENYN